MHLVWNCANQILHKHSNPEVQYLDVPIANRCSLKIWSKSSPGNIFFTLNIKEEPVSGTDLITISLKY